MMKFYTAVGQYKVKADRSGRKYPIVIKDGQEYCLSMEEMIIWVSSLWKIHTYDELEKTFYCKEREAHILGDAEFDSYLNRLEMRGLMVSGRDITDEGALYNLLSKLHVVPIKVSFISKLTAFIRLSAVRKMPLSVTKKVFCRMPLTDNEKRVVNLSEQFPLSMAELIACFDNGALRISTEQQLIGVLYGASAPADIDLKAQAYVSDNRRIVMEAVANLYLKQAILLQ